MNFCEVSPDDPVDFFEADFTNSALVVVANLNVTRKCSTPLTRNMRDDKLSIFYLWVDIVVTICKVWNTAFDDFPKEVCRTIN